MTEDKTPKIKTLKDKGAKIDYLTLPGGRELFVFEEEKFRGVEIAGVRLGWSNKFQVISPTQLTGGTIKLMSDLVTNASGAQRLPSDFSVIIGDKKVSKEDIR